jgi:hypothetical protein
MRLLALVIGFTLLLFVRGQFDRVAEQVTSGKGAPVPEFQYQPPAMANVNSEAIVGEMNPKIDINTKKYERLGVQSAADNAVRQQRMAQDQAWAASHPGE